MPTRRDRGVFQRPGSPYWWISWYVHGVEKRLSSKSTVKRDAIALRAQLVAAQRQGLPDFDQARRLTISVFLDRAQAEYTRRGGRALKQYLAHQKPVRQAFGGRRVLEVDGRVIEAFVTRQQRQGYAGATINHHLGILRGALRLAEREGIIARLPYMPRVATAPARQGFWEPEEVARVLACCPDWLRDIVQCAYLTGWRRGEILGLQWEMVDWEARTIALAAGRTKTGRGRLLPLVGDLEALFAGRQAVRVPSPWVFHRQGRRITADMCRKAWDTARDAAGIPKLFHDFRRTAYRNMIRAGVPERIVMEITGHRSRSMGDRYNIVDVRDMRQGLAQTYAYLEQKTPVIVAFPERR